MPNRGLSESDSDSDELPSLTDIKKWAVRDKTSSKSAATPVRRTESIEDPAEEAKSRTVRKRSITPASRGASSVSSPASRTSSRSTSVSLTNGEDAAPSTVRTGRKQLSRASSSELIASRFTLQADNRSSSREGTTAGPSAAASTSATPHAGARKRPATKDDRTTLKSAQRSNASTTSWLPASTSRDPQGGRETSSASSLASQVDDATTTASTTTVPQITSKAKLHSSEQSALRKSRRITIITISDSSDEDAPAPAPSVPIPPHRDMHKPSCSTPDHDSDLEEEVSFADYSDEEPLELVYKTKPTAEKPPLSSTVIEIDSSDSDYDTASGVISWNPTPNKPKNIVKPFSPLPLSAISTPSQQSHPLPLSRTVFRSVSGPSIVSVEKENGSPLPLPRTPLVKDKTTGKTPRKAANAFAKQRDALALKLVEELNDSVFSGGLPQDLRLVWNGRLNTTAGRASWKKSTSKSTGLTVHKAEVELSVKVIDCEEKLRCTLAHELCHIAAWVINKEMKPSHGPAFKAWGRQVMKVRPDIKVTTKHSYEIAYKYQWQCTATICGKVYGRHSKSIDPAKHACGVCSSRLVRLDKEGNPVQEPASTGIASPRAESDWSRFSKTAFKRIKTSQPDLTMIQINALVAAEWRQLKTDKATASKSSAMESDDLVGLESLRL